MKKLTILVTLSLIISITSLCLSLIRTQPYTIDVLALLVGVLAISVTILIGWQLVNYFFLKEEIDRKTKESINKSFKDFFPVNEAYMQTVVCNLVGVAYDERSFDIYIRCLEKITSSNSPEMKEFALKETIDELKNTMKALDERGLKSIFKNKRRGYLRILEKIDHPIKDELIDFINEAIDVASTHEAFYIMHPEQKPKD